MKKIKRTVALVLSLALVFGVLGAVPFALAEDTDTVKIACVGDSITYGYVDGGGQVSNPYPKQLGALLGEGYTVENFGVTGSTANRNSNAAYSATEAYTQSLAFAPDVVIIMLGTNDARGYHGKVGGTITNAEYISMFKDELKWLIGQYAALDSQPEILLATSPAGNNHFASETITNEIVPMQKEVATELGMPIVDTYTLTKGQSAWYNDQLHFNNTGYAQFANAFAAALEENFGLKPTEKEPTDADVNIQPEDIIFNLDFTNYQSYTPIRDTVTGTVLMESGLEAKPDYADNSGTMRDGVYLNGNKASNGIHWTADVLDPMKQTEGGFTLNMWVLFTDKQTNTMFFGYSNDITDKRNFLSMWVQHSNDNSITATHYVYKDERNQSVTGRATPNSVYSKNWYMITLTQDPSDNKLYFYLNGNQENKAEFVSPGSIYESASFEGNTPAIYSIGGRLIKADGNALWDDRVMTGVMSNVTMFGRALNQDEISALYNGMEFNYADYTAVKEALAKIPADLSVYTPESVAALTAAKNGVISGLMVEDQDKVDAMAAAIEKAIDELELNIADTDADEAAAVDALIAALPGVEALTADDAEAVYAVSQAYASLSSVGKLLTEKGETLLALEAKIRELKGVGGIANLKAYDPDNDFNWTIRNDAQTGDQAYGDRRIYFSTLPAYLEGADYIRPAMNSKKWNAGETLAEFDVYASADLYIAWEQRIPLPEWMNEYEATNDYLNYTGNTDAVMRFYRKSVAAGEHIKLGTVNSDNACYTVFLTNHTPDAEPEPAPAQKELSRVVKVACVGDSITYSSGASDREKTTYPAFLGQYLGESYEVKNFGVSGSSLMNADSDSYRRKSAYTDSLNYNPDIVIIMLGTNDSQPRYSSKLAGQFKTDYLSLIAAYQALPSNPKIYLATSPYSHTRFYTNPAAWEIRGDVIEKTIVPMQKEIATETGLDMVDMHAATYRTPYFPDSIHPNDEGNAFIAKVFYEAVFDYLPEGVKDLNAPVDPDQEAADAVDEMIEGLGEITSPEQKEAVEAARAAYDALTDAQKALVTELAVLEAAEAAIANLEKAAVVEKMIADIGEITSPDQKEAVEAARTAYDALTDAQKALVGNLATLEAAEEALEAFVPQYPAGDVDKSGVVDVADIMKLKALIMADKWSEEELSIGDLNESEALDVGDIMAVKNIIMAS